MMTDYDISRIAASIVDRLVNDDKFITRVAKVVKSKKGGRMLNSKQAADLLGITRGYVCDIAPQLGGVRRGDDKQRAKWYFPEDGLIERFRSL